MKFKLITSISAFFLMLSGMAAVSAQTTAFTYQGRLTDGGNPANGNFLMQFKLFDTVAGGAQIGPTLNDVAVVVSNGTFSTKLDFGAAPLSGANRWLEISVRRNSGEAYVLLSPREQIASSPYAVRTLSAAMADDSQKLGGVNASDYVTTTNGGTSFIRNQSTQQASSAFNVSGSGIVGGNLGVGTDAPSSKVDIRGNLTLEAGTSPTLYTGTGGVELNRYLNLINSPTSGSASGLKAGGILVSDNFAFASPGKNDLIVKGNVGIGTAAPGTRLSVFSNFYGVSHTDGTVSVSTFLNSSGGWFGTRSNHPLHFYTNDGGQQMTLTPAGNLGIGTTNPQAGLELRGAGIQERVTDATSGNSLVLQAGTGINTKITGYNYGTGTAVPLYISVDGANTILNPAGGNVGIGALAPNAKLSVSGNITQNSPSFGIPKAIVFVQANGTIARCYNGVTGSTTGGCGFSVTGSSGTYTVNFGFDVSARFYSMTSSSVWLPGVAALTGRLGLDGSTPNVIHATFWRTSDHATTPSDFTLIVY